MSINESPPSWNPPELPPLVPPSLPLAAAPAPVNQLTAASAATCQPVEPSQVQTASDAGAVEVTALLGDTVVDLRQLRGRGGQRPSWLALALGGAAVLCSLGAVAAALGGGLGLAALLMPLGVGLAVVAHARLRGDGPAADYTVGEAVAADLHLRAPELPSACHPVVALDGAGQAQLAFSAQMEGDVTLDPGSVGGESIPGERVPLQHLVQSGAARAAAEAGVYRYPLPVGAVAQLRLGQTTLLVRAVRPSAPMTQPLWDRLSPREQVFTGASLALHCVVLALVLLVPPDGRSLSLDMFNVDDVRVQTRLLPVQPPEGEMDRFLRKKTPQPAGKDGAPHKGQAGKMGRTDAKRRDRRFAVKGTDQAARPARELARQAAQRMGVLGLLGGRRGGALASIFSTHDHALGDQALNAMGNLIGNQMGDSVGFGGLGPVGSGRGGGGGLDGSEWIGLRGPLGTVGKGGGDPNGRGYGRLTGPMRKHRTRRIPGPTPKVRIKGALSKAIIRRVVRRHLNQVRYCYQQELQSSPDLYGRVVVRFAIMGTGQVGSSVIESSSLKHAGVEQCISQAVRRWLFPKPEGGGTVVVSYPFVLHSAGQH